MGKRGTDIRSSGWVRWPADWVDTEEGGMYVVAVWMVDRGENLFGEDRFARCFEAESVRMRFHEPIVTGDAGVLERAVWGMPIAALPRYADGVTNPVLAMIQLGSTNASYTREGWGSELWSCTRDDLAPEGRSLVATLDGLYGREAVLLTLLDT